MRKYAYPVSGKTHHSDLTNVSYGGKFNINQYKSTNYNANEWSLIEWKNLIYLILWNIAQYNTKHYYMIQSNTIVECNVVKYSILYQIIINWIKSNENINILPAYTVHFHST